ncbi:TniQ family protein [Roseivivax marinus]|uniref:TniQ family protein n=1 Tax=Roseivivax marinus TaxID=1379903 RepID=UPI001F04C71A|nr:TniQ family protein [Roseivivax marinus]UMA63347.1 TniQ family protein [Roseivivax marinus]
MLRTPLPLRVDLADRETAFSFMARLAAMNGTDAQGFGLEQDIAFQRVLDGEPQAVAELAMLGGTDASQLTAWTARKQKGRRHMLRGEPFPGKLIRDPVIRGCPVCLRQDAAASLLPPEQAMALRGTWTVPNLTLCLEHDHPLVPLWRHERPTERYNTVARFRSIAPDIVSGTYDRETREPTDFDEWIEARLTDGPSSSWLDQHPLHAAATFCFLLGSALMRHETAAPSDVHPDDRWALLQMGFAVARHGPTRIREALQRLQDLPGEPYRGPKAIYPVLYDRLSRDYRHAPEFAPFREVLRTHLIETWPLGTGDDLLGEPVEQRKLHSVQSASRETGIDPRRLRKMLRSRGLIADQRPDAWEVFDAAAAEPLLNAMTRLVPATHFARSLGMSRSQFDRLVADGILQPALETSGTKSVWDPRAGQAMLTELFAGAEPLRQAQHGWEHISKSASRLKIGPGVIIDGIREGLIRRVGRHSDFDGYAALYVYHDEVASAVADEAPEAMSLELFAKTVGIGRPIQLRRLVANGHTTATRLRNPRTGALQPYITGEDADAFHATFYTLRTASRSYGFSWQSLVARLKRAGVQPFSSAGEAYGDLYLKRDVDEALEQS